ncbi:MAG: hypothetical protein E7C49_12530 [Clostridium sp.]|nr:hypothetical protein [Clostridium sp.]
MNYEKIVLELFTRVKGLEERVEELEEKVSLKNDNTNSVLEESEVKITRNYSRQHVIDKLRENNLNVLVDKANRAMGSGIVIKDKNSGEILKCKFYHSKSHNDICPSGWHTVNEEELKLDIDIFIFNVEYQREFYTFMFTSNELKDFIKEKEKDQNQNYYFYFNIKDGKAFEYRDGEKEVTQYLNRWDIISKIV